MTLETEDDSKSDRVGRMINKLLLAIIILVEMNYVQNTPQDSGLVYTNKIVVACYAHLLF